MTDPDTADAIREGDENRAVAQQGVNERLVQIKQRQSLFLTAAVCGALVAVVCGVVVPVWLDKSDSAERRADLDALAVNASKQDQVLDQVRIVTDQIAEDNSPQAQAVLVGAVEQLIGIVKCNDLANLDLLVDKLQESGWSITDGGLACPESPPFEYPPTTIPG